MDATDGRCVRSCEMSALPSIEGARAAMCNVPAHLYKDDVGAVSIEAMVVNLLIETASNAGFEAFRSVISCCFLC